MRKTMVLTTLIAGLTGASLCAEDAKVIYEKSCAKCHGADGKGATKMGQKLGVKDYTDPKVQAAIKDEEAFKAIKEGVKEKGSDKFVMKATEGVSDAEIKSLVTYIRSFKK